jgi:hypothetical protein
MVVALGAAAVAIHAAASSPARPGYTVVLSGTASDGERWDLSARRSTISGQAALCLAFSTSSPGGFGFDGGGCAAGSLRAWENVFPVAVGGGTGANLVGGFTVDRARKVTVSFADGKRVTTGTRLGPKGFRRALDEPVRFFAVNASSTSKARARSVAVFDAGGTRIGRGKLGPG